MSKPHKPILVARDHRDAKEWCYTHDVSWRDVTVIVRAEQLAAMMVHHGQVRWTSKAHMSPEAAAIVAQVRRRISITGATEAIAEADKELAR